MLLDEFVELSHILNSFGLGLDENLQNDGGTADKVSEEKKENNQSKRLTE